MRCAAFMHRSRSASNILAAALCWVATTAPGVCEAGGVEASAETLLIAERVGTLAALEPDRASYLAGELVLCTENQRLFIKADIPLQDSEADYNFTWSAKRRSDGRVSLDVSYLIPDAYDPDEWRSEMAQFESMRKDLIRATLQKADETQCASLNLAASDRIEVAREFSVTP